jgi:tetratricopeptide (TPR) repeat protein
LSTIALDAVRMSSSFAPAPRRAPPAWLWQTAQQAILQGKLGDGRARLQALLAQVPAHVPARMLLAGTVLAEGRVRGATEELVRAAGMLPNDPALVTQLAQSLSRLGETNAARACLGHPAVARTRNGEILTALGHIYQGLGLNADALRLMDRARELGYDTPDFRYYRALQLQFNGRLAEAESEMERCLASGSTIGRASLSLARIRRQTPASNHVQSLRTRLRTVTRGTEDHAALEFALYKELEDLGETAEAWSALQRANGVMAERLPYDAASETRLFDAIIDRFDAEFMARPASPLPGPTPIFVVGMPRSGTTLLERMLGSHSMVASAGELNDLSRQLRWTADKQGKALIDETLLHDMATLDFELAGRRYLEQAQWRAGGKPFFVDKLPPNFMLVGCIRRALPHARVVHMVRDPMDVCFSNYRAMFGDAYEYSYDLNSLASHYEQYRRLMQHWRDAAPGFVIDVSYAELVQDTESSCRRLLEACGLPFESGCLDPTRNTSSVATLSSAQVRQPIHNRGLGEWRRYAAGLEPLRTALGF